MTYVADASVVVAALADDGEDGRWALDVLHAAPLATPRLVLVEAANILPPRGAKYRRNHPLPLGPFRPGGGLRRHRRGRPFAPRPSCD